MNLPIPIDYAPAESEQADELPTGEGWQYEPKWDGFRCLAFRDGDEVDLRSKAGKPLGRYFPDVVDALASLNARRFVLDGEIVVPVGDTLSFEELQLRLHPAASRVQKLAAAHPAILVAFDLLLGARGGPLIDRLLSVRREKLEAFAGQFFDERVRLSPATTDEKRARGWLERGERGLDGVMAKRLDLPYQSGERTGMVKVKNVATVDCVVGGFRYAQKEPVVGSLLLGLYGDDGLLHHVGFTSGISREERRELTPRLEALRKPPGFTGSAPGGPSRWSAMNPRSTEWEPLAPELVVEVGYDAFTGGRFRHGTRFYRWRPDKAPEQCTFAQLRPAGRSSLRMLQG
ncbi:MAG TPA: ATP-dependent DNA ligase [Longimicrobium sp.]|nr:ATP-dependent DNA ligase [Longimicrobium sp.]